MNNQNEKTQKNYLIVKNPKNPNLARFYSKFPIGGSFVQALFWVDFLF